MLWLLYINLRATICSPQPTHSHSHRPTPSDCKYPPNSIPSTNTTLPHNPSAGTDVTDMPSASSMATTAAHHLEQDEQELQQQQHHHHQQHQRIGSVTSAGDIVVDDGSATVIGTPGGMGTLRRGPSKHYLSGTCVLTPTDALVCSNPNSPHTIVHNVIPETCGLLAVCNLHFRFPPSLVFLFCSLYSS